MLLLTLDSIVLIDLLVLEQSPIPKIALEEGVWSKTNDKEMTVIASNFFISLPYSTAPAFPRFSSNSSVNRISSLIDVASKVDLLQASE